MTVRNVLTDCWELMQKLRHADKTKTVYTSVSRETVFNVAGPQLIVFHGDENEIFARSGTMDCTSGTNQLPISPTRVSVTGWCRGSSRGPIKSQPMAASVQDLDPEILRTHITLPPSLIVYITLDML